MIFSKVFFSKLRQAYLVVLPGFAESRPNPFRRRILLLLPLLRGRAEVQPVQKPGGDRDSERASPGTFYDQC